MNNTVKLNLFLNKEYKPGHPVARMLWYAASCMFFRNPWPFPLIAKIFLLRIFGAKVGEGVIIKPSVRIKYPWFLEIGDNVWIGEEVWIDNLVKVRIGNNACLSQGAFILTGNHDYKKETFDLITGSVTVEDGAWVGAKAILCPGVTLKSHSVVTAGSVVTKETQPYMVYRGNPAVPVRERKIDR